jgi:hypothetical protein
MVSILTIYVQYQRPYSSYFSAATLEASLASVGAVATNSDCGVILLVASTFATWTIIKLNFVLRKKASTLLPLVS